MVTRDESPHLSDKRQKRLRLCDATRRWSYVFAGPTVLGNSLARESRPLRDPLRFGSSDPLLWPALLGRPTVELPLRTPRGFSQELTIGLISRSRQKPFKRWQVVEFWGMTAMMIQSAVGRLDRQIANQIPYRSLGPRRIHY